jgi:hypothetical protein
MKLIGWQLVVYGTSHHPYNPIPSTAPPIPQFVVNNLSPPVATPPYDFINNRNVPRFLPPDSKAIRVGPCRRPVQIPPLLPASDNGIASYNINELPASLPGRGSGKTNVFADERGGKEGSRSGLCVVCFSEWDFTFWCMVTLFAGSCTI